MSFARVLSNEEFDRDWAAIRRRVLGHEDLWRRFWSGDPFEQPGWPKAALEGHVLVNPWEGTSSWCKRYPEALKLKPGDNPLLRTLKEFGTTDICISGRMDDPHVDATFPWNRHRLLSPDLDGIRMSHDVAGSSYGVVFSREANWGVVVTFNDYSILAGEPPFMDAFFRNAGGLRAVQLRFYWHDDESGDHVEDPSLYEVVGWPTPEYTVWEPYAWPIDDLDGEDKIRWEAPWRSEMR